MIFARSLTKQMQYIVLVLCFFSFFKGIFSWIFRVDLFEYFDEIVFIFAITYLAITFLLSKKLSLLYILITLFIVYSVTISLLFGVSSNALKITLQSFISIKFFLMLLALSILFKDDLKLLHNFFLFVIKFAFFGLAIHLLLGNVFNEIVDVNTFARPNLRYVGFFTHPNHLAYIAVVAIAYLLNYIKINNLPISMKSWGYLSLGILVLFLSDSRTGILAVALLFVGFYWDFILNNYKIFLGFIITGIIGLTFLLIYTDLYHSIQENIADTFNLESHYIRGNMIYLSGLITLDYFPLGTGAATFGSLLSEDAVYAIYGQADRYYFANKMGIYDSNVASILGEYGFIGIVFFSLMFYQLIRHLNLKMGNRLSMVKAFILMFLFYSITNPMLTNNFYGIISAMTLILFLYPLEQEKKDVKK